MKYVTPEMQVNRTFPQCMVRRRATRGLKLADGPCGRALSDPRTREGYATSCYHPLADDDGDDGRALGIKGRLLCAFSVLLNAASMVRWVALWGSPLKGAEREREVPGSSATDALRGCVRSRLT